MFRSTYKSSIMQRHKNISEMSTCAQTRYNCFFSFVFLRYVSDDGFISRTGHVARLGKYKILSLNTAETNVQLGHTYIHALQRVVTLLKLPKCDSDQRFRSRQVCLRRRRTAGENGRFPYTKIIVNISFGLWHQDWPHYSPAVYLCIYLFTAYLQTLPVSETIYTERSISEWTVRDVKGSDCDIIWSIVP
jgi:hypothetical protein